MRKLLLMIAGVVGMFSTTASAIEPPVDLTPQEAVRLIVMKTNTRANAVAISFIVDGTSKVSPGFEAKNVRRVAAIHPVREGSAESRKLVFYDVFWNESLGWFMWTSRNERAGEVVYIWSQLKGEIVNK